MVMTDREAYGLGISLIGMLIFGFGAGNVYGAERVFSQNIIAVLLFGGAAVMCAGLMIIFFARQVK